MSVEVGSELFAQLLVHDLAHLGVVALLNASLADVVVGLKHLLEGLHGVLVVFLKTENIEGLLLRHESALDSESLLGNLTATQVSEFLAMLLSFAKNVLDDLVPSFIKSQWPDHVLIGILGFLSRLHTVVPRWALFGLFFKVKLNFD